MIKVREGSYADIVSYYAVFDDSGALNAHTPAEQASRMTQEACWRTAQVGYSRPL